MQSWDLDKLKIELENIDGTDTGLFGLSQGASEDEVFEDDFDPNEHVPDIPLVNKEIFTFLGKHRLACGDFALTKKI